MFPFACVVVALCTAASPAPSTVDVRIEGEHLNVAGEIVFESGKASLLPASKPVIDAVAAFVVRTPQVARLRVEGHTDDQGVAAANLALSEQRAAAVRRALIVAGVPPARIEARGYGATRPFEASTSEAARRRNRRVVFSIVPAAEAAREVDALARVTAKENVVTAKEPEKPAWREATVGLELHEAWRVNAEERSAADITFQDTSMLHLRENTVVIIFGEEVAGNVRRKSAELERGTLRGRLSELAGKGGSRLAVRTPSAEAELVSGSSVVSVDDKAASRIANLEGAPVRVASRAMPSRSVLVTEGTGSTVEQGKAPTAPKPLPKTPEWLDGTPTALLALPGAETTINGTWKAVAGATRYRVEVARSPNGADVVTSVVVPATVTRFEATGMKPGAYYAAVAALDGDGFESKPTPPRVIRVAGVSTTVPGDPKALPVQRGGAVRVVPGTALALTEGKCARNDDEPTQSLVFMGPGEARMSCTTSSGDALPPFDVDIVSAEAKRARRPDEPELLVVGRPHTIDIALQATAPIPADLDVQAPNGVKASVVEVRAGAVPFSRVVRATLLVEKASAQPLRVAIVERASRAVVGSIALPVSTDRTPPAFAGVAFEPASGERPPAISAELMDDDARLVVAKVHYRSAGAPTYASMPLLPVVGRAHSLRAELPRGLAREPIEYYVEAFDDVGNGPSLLGSESQPQQVADVSTKLSRWTGLAPIGLGLGLGVLSGFAIAHAVGEGEGTDLAPAETAVGIGLGAVALASLATGAVLLSVGE